MKRTAIAAAALSMVAAVAIGCEDAPAPVITEVGPQDQLENPRPVSGGSLLVSGDGALAVVADGDLDQLQVFDTATLKLIAVHQLSEGDEPGRLVEATDGVVYTALRSSGDVVRLDLASGELARASACPAPRGIAHDPATSTLHVACAGGELVSFSAALEVTRTLRLDRDLRDVLVAGDLLVVSRFRSAEVLGVERDGSLRYRMTPADFLSRLGTPDRMFHASVAWRMVDVHDGLVAVIHQRSFAGEIPVDSPGGEEEPASSYGGDGRGPLNCDVAIVHAAATLFDPATGQIVNFPDTAGIGTLVLPVDADVDPNSNRIAVVAAGNDRIYLNDVMGDEVIDNCSPLPNQLRMLGEPISVAFLPSGDLLVHTRQPAALHRVDPNNVTPDVIGLTAGTIEPVATEYLPGPSRSHVGHAIFHKAASELSPVACASCHPEARDDGRVWRFQGLGARRTQNVQGGLLDTLPLHWEGELGTLHDLMGEVFVDRMGGTEVDDEGLDSLASWLHAQPVLPPSTPSNPDAVARGESLFHSAEVGCATCHGGVAFTNNQTVQVGTGLPLQVPSLRGIAHRAPFMHDGCAPTLTARFTARDHESGSCTGGDEHGHVSHLATADIADLVAYLETL
jgi:DNA-binding beta-propeller fold protein YncE